MAKFRVWAETNKMGSTSSRIVEIDDRDIEGMSRDEIWDDYLKDAADELVETGFNPVISQSKGDPQ